VRRSVGRAFRDSVADGHSIVAMTWVPWSWKPEVRDWLESLPTALFARAAFYVDLLAEHDRCWASRTLDSLTASSANCGSTLTAMRSGSPTGSPRVGGSSC
jgi:hypothetical protein